MTDTPYSSNTTRRRAIRASVIFAAMLGLAPASS
jgi:hypothetical protein